MKIGLLALRIRLGLFGKAKAVGRFGERVTQSNWFIQLELDYKTCAGL